MEGSAGWRFSRQPADQPQPSSSGPGSYGSQQQYAGPTPDCPPVFWAPTYNPLALLPRDDGDDHAAYEQPQGPASYGHAPLSSRLRPTSPPALLPPRSPLSHDAAAAYREAQAAVPARVPSPAEPSTSSSLSGPVEVPKRRLEFLREEGAKSTFDSLRQRIQDDAHACMQVRAPFRWSQRPPPHAGVSRLLTRIGASCARRGDRCVRTCARSPPGAHREVLSPSLPQFVAETEEQQQQLKALRKELEELQGVLTTLASERHLHPSGPSDPLQPRLPRLGALGSCP